MEIELKLALPPEAARRLPRLPMLRGRRGSGARVYSVYLDTPRRDLMARGVALRVRRAGRQWLQTLKAEADGAGALSRRPEWEVTLPRGHHDLARFPADAQALMARLADEGVDWSALAPVFVTEFRRQSWQVQQGESVMELALDQGEIRVDTRAETRGAPQAGTQTQALCEVEIELKSGATDAVFELALALLEHLPLTLEPRSKAVRGHLLAGALRAAPVKARATALPPHLDAARAWARLAEDALAQAVANVPGFLAQPDDIEYLHQLRVGLRRLHGMAELAQFLAEGRAVPAWDEALKTVMEALNAARDWDVLWHETLPPLAARLDPPLSRAFLDHLGQHAAQARAQAQEAIRQQDFTRLVLQIERSLHAPEASPLDTVTWASACLEARWARVRKRGKGFAELDGRQRHRLRIAAKRLRYVADTLAPVFKGGKTFRARLAALQDGLGAQQDHLVAMALLAHLGSRAPQVQYDAGRVVGMLAHGLSGAEAGGEAAWRALNRVRPYWRKAGRQQD